MLWYELELDIREKLTNFLSGRINSEKYIKLLNNQLNKHVTHIAGSTFIFQ